MCKPPRVLVLGVGNLLLGDEGFGVHAVRRLERESVPSWVTLEDGGTRGVDLLEMISSYDRVILIDCIGAQVFPGAEASPGDLVVFRLSAEEIRNPDPHLSLHACSLGGLIRLAEALNVRLPEIIVVGFVPVAIGWSTELSSLGQTGLETATARVRDLLRGSPSEN